MWSSVACTTSFELLAKVLVEIENQNFTGISQRDCKFYRTKLRVDWGLLNTVGYARKLLIQTVLLIAFFPATILVLKNTYGFQISQYVRESRSAVDSLGCGHEYR